MAVRDVSFELTPGVTGLLGPNGAGKSTLVRCLAGLCGWDDGEVRIAGIDPAWRARDARGTVGFMPERVSFPPEMRVDQYLRFAAEGKGIRPVRSAARRSKRPWIGPGSTVSGPASSPTSPRATASGSGLAQALLGEPPVLILDEPSAGLDPLHVIEIRTVLQRYAEERVVLVSTHSLGEVRQLCSRVLVLSQGRLVYDGSTAGMADTDSPRFRVTALRESTNEEHELFVEAENRLALGHQVAALSSEGWLVTGVAPVGDPLEDAFRRAVGGGPIEAGA